MYVISAHRTCIYSFTSRKHTSGTGTASTGSSALYGHQPESALGSNELPEEDLEALDDLVPGDHDVDMQQDRGSVDDAQEAGGDEWQDEDLDDSQDEWQDENMDEEQEDLPGQFPRPPTPSLEDLLELYPPPMPDFELDFDFGPEVPNADILPPANDLLPNDDPIHIPAAAINPAEVPDVLDLDDFPPAFYEDPLIRNTYIRVFLEATFNHATEESVKSQLDTHYTNFCHMAARTGTEIPGLAKMARTLRTVERRLGVDADSYIWFNFLCPVCWHFYEPKDLATLPHDSKCIEEYCEGVVFTLRRLAHGKRRVPAKILPTTPFIPHIQRILLRPGKFEDFQRWRCEGDEAGRAPPLQEMGWDTFPDPNVILTDIVDGWTWRATRAAMQRQVDNDGSVVDRDVLNLNQRFVSLLLGIMVMINIDWCVSSIF